MTLEEEAASFVYTTQHEKGCRLSRRPRKCVGCGTIFIYGKSNKRFCSRDCAATQRVKTLAEEKKRERLEASR